MKRSRFHTGGLRRMTAWILCCALVLAAVPVAAAQGHTVTFVNYDLSDLGADHLFADAPAGTRLYTAEELSRDGVEVQPSAGCTWYLYYPGGGDVPSYGPAAVPDPPARDGYTFRDWAAQGAAGDDVYTVTGNTVFVARYASDNQYILNLYYQFDNDASTVAAETSTTPYGWGEAIAVRLPNLPSLEGLTPQITVDSADPAVQEAAAALNGMLQGDGTFSGQLNQEFLDHCRTAGFAVWDEDAGDFQKDENGNVQINLPITYTLTEQVEFQVAYYWQDPEDPTQYTLQKTVSGTVTGTTRVSLREMGLVETYEGFALTAASEEDADSYSVNANGSSTIALYYDRNVHYLYYQMNGGNAADPLQLRYGQTIPQDVGQEPVRTGYQFAGWICRDESGAVLETVPATMPDGDLTMEASWAGTDTTVTLVYWLENANDDSYTVAGQQTVSVTSGQTVGYDFGDGSLSTVNFSINDYLTAEAMKGAGISDGEYFTFAYADSSTQWAAGVEGSPKTADGDGSTVINLGYTRNEYTIVFHLGRINGGTYQVATNTRSDTTDPYDWESGHTWSRINVHPTLTMNGQEYFVDNDVCYEITAKYGAYISSLWPAATDETVTEAGYEAEWWELFNQATYYLFTWGTHYASKYYETHSNKNIIGVYPTMSAELIINAENPEIPHHLVGYWSKSSSTKTHHYMFEAVPGTEADSVHSISEYSSYWQVATQGAGGWAAVQGLDFYEYSSMEVRTTNTSAQQNAPAFANVTYQYGCYSGNDVYFFYTYNDYTATYHENNANLMDDTPEQMQTVDFHYLANKNLAEELESFGFDYDYTPQPSYVSSYGNAYTFDGWYTDADLTFPVDWSTENPTSSVNYYAKWKAPTFTLTLIVPGGTLYEESLRQFEEKGYEYTVTTETVDGETVTTYTVSGIPGGTKASEIVSERHGAQSNHSLAFDYWGYMVYGTEQRYLFDESQLVTSDLTLTARWKIEYTGQYTVRYLTEERQTNDLGTVEMDGKTYYRLYPDKTVSGVAVGSTVTEEAQPVEGYLSQAGALTKVVEGASGQAEPVVFDFLYSPISTSVTYHVHYVRDTGVDYGRGEPPEDLVRLAEDKIETVDAASLNQSTIVGEAAVVVSGYTPRDSWNVNFTLSAEENQNHIYIYYVSNTLTVPFQVVFHIQASDGTYPADAVYTIEGTESLGKVLQAQDLAVGYGQYLEDPSALEALLTGHTLDAVLTAPYLLLTSEAQNNVLHLYMKNGAYAVTYHLGGSEAFPASWDPHDDFLTAAADGDAYFQTVTYPAAASVPRTYPQRLGHTLTGWNTEADGSGTFYAAGELSSAPWYGGSVSSDVHLYAQWESQLVAAFQLRGGTWTDNSGRFHNAGTDEEPQWVAYVTADGVCPQPQDPSFVLPGGTAYSFIGWTATNPETWTFVDSEDRVDLVQFEQYRFDFSQPIQAGTTLYAVWDPDVTTVAIEKTDTAGIPLAGAGFTLERLQATVSGSPDTGYTYTLVTDESGAYVVDGGFVPRTLVSGQDGLGAFANLPAGYYRLTETEAPAGYQGLTEPVILFAPYGGEPIVWDPLDNPYVTGMPERGDLSVQIQNISQYSVTIDAPSSLTLTYAPPDLIWNPETLSYEGSTESQWQVSASAGEETAITVTNTSLSAVVQVSVTLQYDAGYQALLPLSTLTGPDGFTEYGTAETKSLQGTLPGAAAAIFRLNAAGTVPLDVALPSEETRVGGITVRVSRTNLLNPAWQSRL